MTESGERPSLAPKQLLQFLLSFPTMHTFSIWDGISLLALSRPDGAGTEEVI